MTAPAYLIVEMNITDMERYKEYMAKAPACVKAYGGEYIVRERIRLRPEFELRRSIRSSHTAWAVAGCHGES